MKKDIKYKFIEINQDIFTKIIMGNWYKNSTPEIKAKVQLHIGSLLFKNFNEFHVAIEKVLDRYIATFEFADSKRLFNEYIGKINPPTKKDIADRFRKIHSNRLKEIELENELENLRMNRKPHGCKHYFPEKIES